MGEPQREAKPTAQTPVATVEPRESRGERLRRRGRHLRLYAWSILLVATLVVIVALVASNTRRVRVSWVVGHSTASLVWLVLVPAVVGWLAGLATAILFRRRTRAPAPDR
jgi:uncharacterized integral membrane protein